MFVACMTSEVRERNCGGVILAPFCTRDASTNTRHGMIVYIAIELRNNVPVLYKVRAVYICDRDTANSLLEKL